MKRVRPLSGHRPNAGRTDKVLTDAAQIDSARHRKMQRQRVFGLDLVEDKFDQCGVAAARLMLCRQMHRCKQKRSQQRRNVDYLAPVRKPRRGSRLNVEATAGADAAQSHLVTDIRRDQRCPPCRHRPGPLGGIEPHCPGRHVQHLSAVKPTAGGRMLWRAGHPDRRRDVVVWVEIVKRDARQHVTSLSGGAYAGCRGTKLTADGDPSPCRPSAAAALRIKTQNHCSSE